MKTKNGKKSKVSNAEDFLYSGPPSQVPIELTTGLSTALTHVLKCEELIRTFSKTDASNIYISHLIRVEDIKDSIVTLMEDLSSMIRPIKEEFVKDEAVDRQEQFVAYDGCDIKFEQEMHSSPENSYEQENTYELESTYQPEDTYEQAMLGNQHENLSDPGEEEKDEGSMKKWLDDYVDDSKTDPDYMVVSKKSVSDDEHGISEDDISADDDLDSSNRCSVCRLKFSSKKELVKHVYKCGCKCEVCGQTFKTRLKLNNHIKETKHVSEFCCNICFKQLTKEGYLRHMRVKHPEQPAIEMPLVCQTCGFVAKDRKQLRNHSYNHGDQKHKCEFCPKVFARKYYLTAHLRIHTGEKPFRCEICGVTFRVSNQLSIHKRTHTGRKDYVCTLCGKGFNQNGNLRTHMKSHQKGTLPVGLDASLMNDNSDEDRL